MQDRYELLKVLGKGSYGVAMLARHRPLDPGEGAEPEANRGLLVLKEIDLSQLPERARQSTFNEAEVLRSLSHRNVVAYIAAFFDQTGDRLCIGMEYADGGDLAAELRRRRRGGGGLPPPGVAEGPLHLSDREVLTIFAQCCCGLRHTHARHILHRDIKGQNIFLTAAGVVKIGDYGIAKMLDSTAAQVRTKVGTPFYTAPEVCDSLEYGLKADVWSLGVVLYEMSALHLPFQAPNLMSLLVKIVQHDPPPLPDFRGEDVHRLVGLALQKDPEARPTCDALLAEPGIACAADDVFVPTLGGSAEEDGGDPQAPEEGFGFGSERRRWSQQDPAPSAAPGAAAASPLAAAWLAAAEDGGVARVAPRLPQDLGRAAGRGMRPSSPASPSSLSPAGVAGSTMEALMGALLPPGTPDGKAKLDMHEATCKLSPVGKRRFGRRALAAKRPRPASVGKRLASLAGRPASAEQGAFPAGGETLMTLDGDASAALPGRSSPRISDGGAGAACPEAQPPLLHRRRRSKPQLPLPEALAPVAAPAEWRPSVPASQRPLMCGSCVRRRTPPPQAQQPPPPPPPVSSARASPWQERERECVAAPCPASAQGAASSGAGSLPAFEVRLSERTPRRFSKGASAGSGSLAALRGPHPGAAPGGVAPAPKSRCGSPLLPLTSSGGGGAGSSAGAGCGLGGGAGGASAPAGKARGMLRVVSTPALPRQRGQVSYRPAAFAARAAAQVAAAAVEAGTQAGALPAMAFVAAQPAPLLPMRCGVGGFGGLALA